ncbi:MAG: tRNA uridine-5-carboxymethylaminomethyl(34) synthesis enzyme MnmG [Vicinamibacterales bacterium]
MRHHEIIVVGAGHAGVEAAWAAARTGRDVAICTLSMDTIAHMPCNPAIGGTAKGHLVREIDALGGLMGVAIDATAIQFKLLNRSRGPAVWSPRAQADKKVYGQWVRAALEGEPGISWLIGRAGRILLKDGRVSGVAMEDGSVCRCEAVVVTTGTFLNGLVHVGLDRKPAGRAGEPPSVDLADSLKSFGFSWGRLKTGTPPRLHRRSIDFSRFQEELGDQPPVPFSFQSGPIDRAQIACHLLYTTERVHALVREHIGESPLFNGQISGVGPRYCPSLEDKVMRFPQRDRHQIFLEPEGLDSDEIYVNGYSMSLPPHVQADIVHALPGLEDAEIVRPGYAVEYDFIQPTELDSSLQARRLPGLFLAGQINGTSGYEEAAAQGLIAGVNAARFAAGLSPTRVGRDEGYIGVLVDDLTTRGCLEPYRMFTSRAEHRLLLRIDNADLRLTPRGRELGLVDDRRWARFEARRDRLERNRSTIRTSTVSVRGQRIPGDRALKQPDVDVRVLAREGQLALDIAEPMLDFISLETSYRYEGYLRRQTESVERLKTQELRVIPADFEFAGIPGLSRESVERLSSVRPETLGQALRIPGITPAAVALVAAHVCGHLTR